MQTIPDVIPCQGNFTPEEGINLGFVLVFGWCGIRSLVAPDSENAFIEVSRFFVVSLDAGAFAQSFQEIG
ncbi:MAG: hypothetical protein E6J48_14570 [Chloroflexi bacterium]|nr:MAG: hypothetical protein E6J48_14570 [Chloroflexota bacterium]